MTYQDVFIIGSRGNVGNELVSQILAKDTGDNHEHPTRIVGLASRDQYIYEPQGIQHHHIRKFQQKLIGRPYFSDEMGALENVRAEIDCDEHEQLVFVDVTADPQMLDFHKMTMQHESQAIVTANKYPVAHCSMEEFREITGQVRRYGYSCSVMAGADAVPALRDMYDLSDTVKEISACISGTNNFILSELEKGKKFSEIVRFAKEKGYTEPDPRQDLRGLDVARKLVVLIRSAGFDIDIDDVYVEPLFEDFRVRLPDEEPTLDIFMKYLEEYDEAVLKRFEAARLRGNTIRYVAQFNNDGAIVGPQEVPQASEMGQLQGTANKIIIISQTYRANAPYIVCAPGAGLEITAQNIRRDLMHLLPERQIRGHNE